MSCGPSTSKVCAVKKEARFAVYDAVEIRMKIIQPRRSSRDERLPVHSRSSAPKKSKSNIVSIEMSGNPLRKLGKTSSKKLPGSDEPPGRMDFGQSAQAAGKQRKNSDKVTTLQNGIKQNELKLSQMQQEFARLKKKTDGMKQECAMSVESFKMKTKQTVSNLSESKSNSSNSRSSAGITAGAVRASHHMGSIRDSAHTRNQSIFNTLDTTDEKSEADESNEQRKNSDDSTKEELPFWTSCFLNRIVLMIFLFLAIVFGISIVSVILYGAGRSSINNQVRSTMRFSSKRASSWVAQKLDVDFFALNDVKYPTL